MYRHGTAGLDLVVIVPQRHVLNTAIVPERDRVGPPAKPHLKFRPGAVLEQIVQDGAALLFGKPVDMGGKSLINSALRLLTGWVRTMGCDALGKTLPRSSRPTSTLVAR